MPDKAYIELKYFAHYRKFAELKSLKTYNKKLTWLIFHGYNPPYTTLADKYETKEHISKISGGGV